MINLALMIAATLFVVGIVGTIIEALVASYSNAADDAERARIRRKELQARRTEPTINL